MSWNTLRWSWRDFSCQWFISWGRWVYKWPGSRFFLDDDFCLLPRDLQVGKCDHSVPSKNKLRYIKNFKGSKPMNLMLVVMCHNWNSKALQHFRITRTEFSRCWDRGCQIYFANTINSSHKSSPSYIQDWSWPDFF